MSDSESLQRFLLRLPMSLWAWPRTERDSEAPASQLAVGRISGPGPASWPTRCRQQVQYRMAIPGFLPNAQCMHA